MEMHLSPQALHAPIVRQGRECGNEGLDQLGPDGAGVIGAGGVEQKQHPNTVGDGLREDVGAHADEMAEVAVEMQGRGDLRR